LFRKRRSLRKHGCKPGPGLEEEVDKQAEGAEHTEDLEELPGISSSNFGLEETFVTLVKGVGRALREAAGREVLLHEGVLLVPPLSQPDIEILLVVQGDVGDTETAPVKIDRLWRLSADVGAREGEDLLSEFAAAVLELLADMLVTNPGVKTYPTPSYATVQS
jgi:hypothetical protein